MAAIERLRKVWDDYTLEVAGEAATALVQRMKAYSIRFPIEFEGIIRDDHAVEVCQRALRHAATLLLAAWVRWSLDTCPPQEFKEQIDEIVEDIVTMIPARFLGPQVQPVKPPA